MKHKLIKAIVLIAILLTVMFMEYQYIIYNLKPYIGRINSEGGGEVYIELFGRTDSYYADPFLVSIKDRK